MRTRLASYFVIGAIVGMFLLLAADTVNAQLKISEFRVRGPNGATDEYVELTNPSTSPLTVTVSDASTGWAVAASDGTTRFVIPTGTIIPGKGHYLGTNSVGYSLGGYAAGDVTFATDIPDNAGIALFNTSIPAELRSCHQARRGWFNI
jgi:hypothetical protein